MANSIPDQPQMLSPDDADELFIWSQANARLERTTRSALVGSPAVTFTDLTDTPAAYAPGDAGKVVTVTGTEDGVEFTTLASGGASTLTDLTDTPAAYTNKRGRMLTINDAETGVQFAIGAGRAFRGPAIFLTPGGGGTRLSFPNIERDADGYFINEFTVQIPVGNDDDSGWFLNVVQVALRNQGDLDDRIWIGLHSEGNRFESGAHASASLYSTADTKIHYATLMTLNHFFSTDYMNVWYETASSTWEMSPTGHRSYWSIAKVGGD